MFNYIMQDYYMDNAMKGGWDRMCVPAQSNLCENNWVKTVKGIAYLNALNTVLNAVDKRTAQCNAQILNLL